MELVKDLQIHVQGKANPLAIVQGKHYRFTVLTEEMLRMEYSESGEFEDLPTQVVFNRDFPRPEFQVLDEPSRLEISTKSFHLVYNKKRFSPDNLYIDLKHNYTNYGGRWLFGTTEYGNPPREHNLKGTARTLDRINGATALEFGLIDQSGRTFFDDSHSLTVDEQGWPQPRGHEELDYYYLGYGHKYYKAIHDFYLLSGKVPLLPRYALGNWWSRYWAYTEESYMELLNEFEAHDIPFSVGVLDMDWHIVNVPEKYGRGWTGYTWNKELFPDPQRLLDWVHKKGYRVTLNLHPADGVMPYEDAYEAMAKELGVNTSLDEPIAFDVTNKAFLGAYFKFLHHPHEKIGVDFWWIDWQQGTHSHIPNLDPLRMLNHFHFIDSQRGKKKRGLIFSRYGGLGSHRYPVGFSGDTIISWESLDFQPYFTATASNIGYCWWSHDIGGHTRGFRDNENFVRWVQLGVFSPINRLHSSANPFFDKLPWSYPKPYDGYVADALRLRHKLVPYTYTMNWRVNHDLIPFIVPMYYEYPDDQRAYDVKNQYFFGSELMVSPITSPTDYTTMKATVTTFIPPGNWIDFFDGTVYHGGSKGRLLKVQRTIDRIPVFAREGAIVPMDHGYANSVDANPKVLDIHLFAGACRTFSLYEDEGDGFGYEKGVFATTQISWDWKEGQAKVTLKGIGDFSVLPKKRSYRLIVKGAGHGIKVAGANVKILSESYHAQCHALVVELGETDPGEKVEVSFREARLYGKEDLEKRMFQTLEVMQMENVKKSDVMDVLGERPIAETIGAVTALDIPQSAKNTIIELLSC